MIGIDLVDISRIRSILKKSHTRKFIFKIVGNCKGCIGDDCYSLNIINTISELFAVKEAVIKASSSNLSIADFLKINVEKKSVGQFIASVAGENTEYIVSTCNYEDYVLAVALVKGENIL
jgi:phosphopantetheinyl transferase (holo-ACP synthase)